MFKNKKAFTLTEMITVIVIIGVLMAGTTIYLQGSDETRKVIEAQGCATTIGGKINNYIFYSLTSKSLRINENKTESPDIYKIKLDDCETININGNNRDLCKGFLFYDEGCGNDSCEYQKKYEIPDVCHVDDGALKVYWENGLDKNSEIIINKGFTRTKKANSNIFYIKDGGTSRLVGDIILYACLDNMCTIMKEVSKWVIDGRTQTISLKNCGIYKEDNRHICEEREN